MLPVWFDCLLTLAGVAIFLIFVEPLCAGACAEHPASIVQGHQAGRGCGALHLPGSEGSHLGIQVAVLGGPDHYFILFLNPLHCLGASLKQNEAHSACLESTCKGAH